MGWISDIQERLNSFFLTRWIRWFFILLLTIPIKVYQYVISPVLPKTCRYYPSCSSYAIEALKVHGPVKGLILGTKRILSCHPWGGHGYDPVPPRGTPLIKLFKSGKK